MSRRSIARHIAQQQEETAKRLSQWFTPEPLARKIAAWSRVEGLRVIEPAAGAGALVSAFAAAGAASIAAVEIDPRLAADLRRRIAAPMWTMIEPAKSARAARAARISVLCADFLALRLGGQLRAADLVGHNPPYEDGADGRFIGRSPLFAPRGVALVRVNALVGLAHYIDAWRRVRVTRIAYLVKRPAFEGLLARRGPRSDFAAIEYVEPGSAWMDGRCTVEHWPEAWS